MNVTVVSFVPWQFKELKPGMLPNEFLIPAREGKTPGILIVKDATSNIYMGMDRPPFPAPVPAEQLGQSIVDDASRSLPEVDSEHGPALFWVPGEFTAEEILKKFPEKCTEAIQKQNKWWIRLVRVADDIWSRFKQHKLITDLQRHAARDLGLNGKEWAMEPTPVSLIKCPACKTMVESDAVICSSCKAILRPDEAKKLGIAFASA
jgi:hypothetical protein